MQNGCQSLKMDTKGAAGEDSEGREENVTGTEEVDLCCIRYKAQLNCVLELQ